MHTTGLDDPGVLAALDKIAMQAVADHWKPTRARVDVAWEAAAEALCVPGEPPPLRDVYKAARDAVTRDEAQVWHMRGLTRANGYSARMARFEAYWWQPPLTGWEDAIVERVAARQIWVELSPAHRRVLRALMAADGDYRAAAAMLDTSYATFRTRLGRARAAFREMWHEGEEPSRQWGCDRQVFRAGDDPDKATRMPVTRTMTRRRRPLAEGSGDRAA